MVKKNEILNVINGYHAVIRLVLHLELYIIINKNFFKRFSIKEVLKMNFLLVIIKKYYLL